MDKTSNGIWAESTYESPNYISQKEEQEMIQSGVYQPTNNGETRTPFEPVTPQSLPSLPSETTSESEVSEVSGEENGRTQFGVEVEANDRERTLMTR